MNAWSRFTSVHKNAEMPQTYPSSNVWVVTPNDSFYTNPNLPNPNAYKFSSGLKQQFPQKVCMINSTLYRTDDLTNLKEDYYPIVITIEAIYPPNYAGRARKSV